MSLFLPTVLLGMLAAGAANASSFAALTPAGTRISPSIIFMGAPAPGSAGPATLAAAIPFAPPDILGQPPVLGEARKPDTGSSVTRISPSVIALGLLQPEVDLSRFAAIEDKPRRMRNPHLPPMVIRGGLSGDAFARAAPAAGGPAQPAAHAPAVASSAPKSAPAKHAPEKPPLPKAPPPGVRPPAPTAKIE